MIRATEPPQEMGPQSIDANSTISALRITQQGAGPALLVEDAASTDASPFVVMGDGKVGVAIAAPLTDLHVDGVIRASRVGTASQYVEVSSGGGSGLINAVQTTLELRSSNSYVALYPNNSERFRIDSNGLITGSGTSLGAWTANTPTVTASAGTFTSVACAGRYTLTGKTCTFTFRVTITTNGTAATAIRVSLPFNASAVGSVNYLGKGWAVTDLYGIHTNVGNGASYATLVKSSDGSYPGADGKVIDATVVYEIA